VGGIGGRERWQRSLGRWQGGGRRCPKALGAAWALLFGPGHRPVGPARFSIFPIYPKLAQHKKFKMCALFCSKNSQFLHSARLGYYEQFSQLCPHSIPNTNIDTNLGPDSTFQSLMNFKRDLNLPKKSGKFSKILSSLDPHKSEFSWVTYM
jgi:hypothetical protein